MIHQVFNFNFFKKKQKTQHGDVNLFYFFKKIELQAAYQALEESEK